MKIPRIAIVIAGATLAFGCASDIPGIDPPGAMLRFPIGVAVIPAQGANRDRYLLAVNSNFDLRYNTSTVVVIDTDTGRILPEHTVRINSFAGDLAIRRDGTRAFVPSRSGSTLTAIDIDLNAPRFLKCTETTPAAGEIPRCESPYVVSVDINPFGILLREAGEVTVGCTRKRQQIPETIVLTHINTSTIGTPIQGIISVFQSETGTVPYEVVTKAATTSGIAGIDVHPLTSTLYVTNRLTGNIALFRADGNNVRDLGTLLLNLLRPGADNRGVAFNPGGTRAFIASRAVDATSGRTAPTLYVFDTTCAPEGRESNRLIQAIDVSITPGKVRYLARANGGDRVYVACGGVGGIGQVYVIDPDLGIVETIISVGEGAYDITFSEGARTGTGRQRAYVSNFREDSISVVELDPASPNFHHEIARLRENPRVLP